jgi:hypothetical protein
MKNIVLILISILLSVKVFSQSKKPKSIYLEIGGKSIYTSINYEHTIKVYEKGYLMANIGASYIPLERFVSACFPVGVKYVFGKSDHHFEAGIGASFHILNTIGIESSNSFGNDKDYRRKNFYRWLYLTPSLGYRYQKPTNGLFFTANLLLLTGVFEYEYYENYGWDIEWFDGTAFFPFPVVPYLGLSIGYSFL